MATRDDDRLRTTGRVLHVPSYYDLFVAFLAMGSERRYRQQLVDVARLRAGFRLVESGTAPMEMVEWQFVLATLAASNHAGATTS
ncbi:MAG: hypothetical protein ACLPSH_15680 [Vulcanimicrobiaceae bacterium]